MNHFFSDDDEFEGFKKFQRGNRQNDPEQWEPEEDEEWPNEPSDEQPE